MAKWIFTKRRKASLVKARKTHSELVALGRAVRRKRRYN
jgi:hypothetical protein